MIQPPGSPLPPHPTSARRWGARWIDWLVPWLVTSPLWFLTAEKIQSEATEHGFVLAGKGIFKSLFGEWGALGDTAGAEAGALWGDIVLVVALTLAVQVLLIMAYEVLLVRVWGRTLGKAAFALTVCRADGGRLSFGQVCARTAITVLIPGLGWVLLIAAVLQLSVPLMLAGVALLIFSAVECCLLRTSVTGKTSWHDRRTGSVVVSKTWTEQLRQAREFQQRALDTGMTRARQAWQAPQVQQFSQQAQATFHQVRERGRQAMRRDDGSP
ncbi:RDD family protein [Amycolatopsis alba]|uniref:RDD family protein n=1 Tax=Amycolatopsis alba DSM 44262 TaxID=1125972 RepID=A0A229RF04_AMYAL|nr:RDD family protein [Amycolatopsis alba]OXM45041.1 RDD family protein [Amycolatopsis alba DSM 44262]